MQDVPSFGWTCYDNITQPCVMIISRSSADPLRAGLCAMITHGNIRNAPARSGSADDRLIIITQGCVMIIITCPPKTGYILHNSTIAVSPDPLFRVRVWLARLAWMRHSTGYSDSSTTSLSTTTTPPSTHSTSGSSSSAARKRKSL